MSPTSNPTRATAGNSTSWSLSNEHLSVNLSVASQGGLAALVDVKTGRNFIADRSVPLYRLILSAQGQDDVEVTSRDAAEVKVQAAADELTLIYVPHRDLEIRGTCH